jgi:hypothetical protein
LAPIAIAGEVGMTDAMTTIKHNARNIVIVFFSVPT